jgi:hypothetical protein
MMRHYQLKTERIADFESASRDPVATLKKTSAPHDFTIWMALTGPREFVRVDRYSKLAELDAPTGSNLPNSGADADARARIQARIGDCIEGGSEVIARIVPEASLPLGDPPAMIEVNVRHFQPGKANEFPALVRNDYLPLAKKAGIKTFFIAQTLWGETVPEYLSIRGVRNWAEFEEDPMETNPEYQAFMAKRRQVSAGAESNVYRFRADLSYLPTQGGR